MAVKKATPNPWGLSKRQAEAMDALVELGSHDEAAKRLNISVKTIQDHMEASSIKMGMKYRNRVQRIVAWDRWSREGVK